MAMGPRVTKETVERIAREMAGIELSPAEVEQLTPQLDRLLSDLVQIPDKELRDIEPPLIFTPREP